MSTTEVKEKKEAKPKPKPPAKAPAKPLPQMMEEDVIPSLKSILETQDDISEIELSFGDNRVSFQLPSLHSLPVPSQGLCIIGAEC